MNIRDLSEFIGIQSISVCMNCLQVVTEKQVIAVQD